MTSKERCESMLCSYNKKKFNTLNDKQYICLECHALEMTKQLNIELKDQRESDMAVVREKLESRFVWTGKRYKKTLDAFMANIRAELGSGPPPKTYAEGVRDGIKEYRELVFTVYGADETYTPATLEHCPLIKAVLEKLGDVNTLKGKVSEDPRTE